MNLLETTTLVITGFVACAEFGSYAFVHPVLRRLPTAERITVEQGLLRTFGRVMPTGMTLCVVLGVTTATATGARPLSWLASAALVVALVSTIVVNVPINRATGRWNTANPPPAWQRARGRWEFFQGVRSWLLLLGFLLTSVAAT